MDDCLLLDDSLVEDDVEGFELVAVTPQDWVTVTVTVSFGQLLQSDAPCCARGTAAAIPSREAKKTFECILSKSANQKNVFNDSVAEDSDYRNQKSRE